MYIYTLYIYVIYRFHNQMHDVPVCYAASLWPRLLCINTMYEPATQRLGSKGQLRMAQPLFHLLRQHGSELSRHEGHWEEEEILRVQDKKSMCMPYNI